MARPDGALVTGQHLSLMFAGPAERQAQAAELIEAVGFEPQWVGHVRYARNLEVRGLTLVRAALPPASLGAEHACDRPAGAAMG